MAYKDQEFNSGIHTCWRIVNAQKKAEEKKAADAAKKHKIEEEEESSYAAAILERVMEVLQSQKRGQTNGTTKDS